MKTSTELLEPRSLGEALRMLRDRGPLTPVAGATDLFAGTVPRGRFLNLHDLGELRGIRAARGLLTIGALATWTDIILSPLIRRRFPMLAAAAREIGGVQIQNRGTIGGNVANASPAGDSLPVLAAAEATVVLRSAAGERRIPFIAFYTGYRASVKRHDELIVALEIPPVEGAQWFRKVGTRQAQAISKVVVAAVRSPRPRIALGSVAPTVVRVPRTEEALAAGASVEETLPVLQSEIHPIDDIRSTAAYRRRVAGNLLARFWKETS